MVDTEQNDAIIDDDEEQLVRQVLAENPAEERGVRDEWAGQVGWHRKEDVSFLRRRGAAPAAGKQKQPDTTLRIREEERDRVDSVVSEPAPRRGREEDTPPSPPESTAWMQRIAQKGVLWVVVFGAVLLILRLAGFRSCSRKKRRAVRTIRHPPFHVWVFLADVVAIRVGVFLLGYSLLKRTTFVRTLPSTSQRSHFVASTVIRHAPCTRATLVDWICRSPSYCSIGWCCQACW